MIIAEHFGLVMVLRGCFGFVLGSVQSWSHGHASSRTCPVPRTLKPAGVWLAPPPVPSCVVYIVQTTQYTETERRFFHSARASRQAEATGASRTPENEKK